MNFIDTIQIEELKNKFYVVAGGCAAIVGEKYNYFRIYPDSTQNEYAAYACLKSNRFPEGNNGFDDMEQALEYKQKFTAYAKSVISLPKKFKVGHSCFHWK
jgi:hypothetical protein